MKFSITNNSQRTVGYTELISQKKTFYFSKRQKKAAILAIAAYKI